MYQSYDADNKISNGHTLNLISPSIAFSIVGKKKSIHDFEIGYTNYQFNNNYTVEVKPYSDPVITNGSKFFFSRVTLGYRYNFIFMKKSTSKLLPSIGFSVYPTYTYNKSVPLISTSFINENHTFSLPIFIEPTVNYFISPRCFIFISIPLKINDIYYRIQRADNPNIPLNMRTIWGVYGETFGKNWTWYLRFGVCIKLK